MTNEPTPRKGNKCVVARRVLLALTVIMTFTLAITNGMIMLFVTANLWQCGPLGLAITDALLCMGAFIASLTAFLFEYIASE